MGFWRYATEEEIKDYETVEAIFTTMSEDEVDDFLDRVSEYALAFGKEQCKKYSKIRKYLKKYNLTAKILRNWYFCEKAG